MVEYFVINYAHLEHGYIFLTANYFISAGAVFALTDFKKPMKWRSDWRYVIIVVLKMLGCIAAGELIASLYYWITSDQMLTPIIISIILTTIYSLAFSKVKMPVRLMRAAEYIAISGLTISITSSIGGILGLSYSYLQWILISVNFIIIFCGTLFLRYFSAEQGVHMHIIFPSIILIVNTACLVFIIISQLGLLQSAASLILSLLLLFIDLSIYFAVSYIFGRTRSEQRRAAEKLQRDAEKEMFRMSEVRLEEMRRLRHELKNQYAYMNVLLENKEYDKLSAYFSELSDKVTSTVRYVDCGNSTINAIIVAEQGRVSGAEASLECRIVVPPELGIGDVDMCSLLMNLINNAVEYLERNPGLEDRKICLEISLAGKTLLVKVTNSLAEADRERALGLETSKPDKRWHGYGTRVVRSIAEKYGGSVVFEEHNGRFVAAAILNQPSGDEGGGRRKERTIRSDQHGGKHEKNKNGCMR